jgi:hypothetical protein
MKAVLLKSFDKKAMDNVLWVLGMFTDPTTPQEIADTLAIKEGMLKVGQDLQNDYDKIIDEYVDNGYKQAVFEYYPQILQAIIVDSNKQSKPALNTDLSKSLEEVKNFMPASVGKGDIDKLLQDGPIVMSPTNTRLDKGDVVTYLLGKGMTKGEVMKMFGGFRDDNEAAKEFLFAKDPVRIGTKGFKIGDVDGVVVTTYNY